MQKNGSSGLSVGFRKSLQAVVFLIRLVTRYHWIWANVRFQNKGNPFFVQTLLACVISTQCFHRYKPLISRAEPPKCLVSWALLASPPNRTKGRAVVSKGFAALSLAQFPLFPIRTTFTADPVATYA